MNDVKPVTGSSIKARIQFWATIAVFLLVGLLLGRSLYRHFNSPDRRAAKVMDAWNDGRRREALALCERLSIREPGLTALLPNMYLDVAQEIHTSDPGVSAEFRDKSVLLVTEQAASQPTNPIRLFAAASVFDRIGNSAKALDFYRRSEGLLDHDIKAVTSGSPLAAGGLVDQPHREAALIELNRQLQIARERIAVIEQEQREFAVDFQLGQPNGH